MRLKITMKSGRVYKTRRLKKFTVKSDDCCVVGIEMKQRRIFRGNGVLINTINLLNIEAIEEII